MIPKRIDEIKKEDVDSLVANEVSEGRTMDYKQALPDGTESGRKEFLADVSSFANASGGDLLYGVEEKRDLNGKPTGVPSAANGIRTNNAEAEILRLENMIRTGIEPRIHGLRCARIDGFVSGPVFLVRVPRSLVAPHMIRFGDSRFYSRTSAGKYPLDVGEIRSAFTASQSLAERIRSFRAERIARISSRDIAFNMCDTAMLVLHVVPLESMDPASQIDIAQFEYRRSPVPPLYAGSGWNSRFNPDGYATYDGDSATRKVRTYLQVFRTGIIEAVEASLFRPENGIPGIPFIAVEQELLKGVHNSTRLLQDLGLNLPFFVLITLVGVRGLVGLFGSGWAPGSPIDRDIVQLPDVTLSESGTTPDALLRPAFDALWQVMGYDKCRNYNEKGEWYDASRPR